MRALTDTEGLIYIVMLKVAIVGTLIPFTRASKKVSSIL